MKTTEREFEITLPENFSEMKPEEQTQHIQENILEQHKTFVAGGFKDYIKPEDFGKRYEEETAKRAEAKAAEEKLVAGVITTAGTIVDPSRAKALVKLSGLSTEDMSDETKVSEALKKAKEENEELFKMEGAGVRKIIKLDDKEKPAPKKRRFFMKNDK